MYLLKKPKRDSKPNTLTGMLQRGPVCNLKAQKIMLPQVSAFFLILAEIRVEMDQNFRTVARS